MLSLTQYGACCRQYGINFRVCFSHNHSYFVVKGALAKLKGSPVHLALTGRGARPIAEDGCEGQGLYYEIESIS